MTTFDESLPFQRRSCLIVLQVLELDNSQDLSVLSMSNIHPQERSLLWDVVSVETQIHFDDETKDDCFLHKINVPPNQYVSISGLLTF